MTSIGKSLTRYNLDNSPAGMGSVRGVIFRTGRDGAVDNDSRSMRGLVIRLLTGRAVNWKM